MAEALATPDAEYLPGEAEDVTAPVAALGSRPPAADGDDGDGPGCPKCKKGAPAWLATFGDLMSLLVAFFVLILSFSDVNVPKHKQIAGSMKEAFGVQRIVPVVELPKATSLIAREFSPTVSQSTPLDTIRQDTTDDTRREVQLRTELKREDFQRPEELEMLEQLLAEEIARGQVEIRIDEETLIVEMRSRDSAGGRRAGESGEGEGAALSQEELETFARLADVRREFASPIEVVVADATSPQAADVGRNEAAEDTFARLRADLAQDIDRGLATVEKDGASVVVRLADQGSFESGSADLQPGFLTVLRRAGAAVAATDGRVAIHGHTDSVPVLFNDRFRSNWDLSAARAATVADFMIDEFDLGGGRLSVSGYADSSPLASNATAAGRAQNRRIEIIVDPM